LERLARVDDVMLATMDWVQWYNEAKGIRTPDLLHTMHHEFV
jgi:hypothetical protein